MSRSINFVRDRQRNLTRLEIQDRQIFRWMLIATSVAVALVLVAVGVRLLFLYQLRQVTEEQKQQREAIAAKEEIERSFTLFSFKLKALTDLFGKRKEKQETLEYFSNLFDKDVVISQLSYSGSDEELTFTLRAKNVFIMDMVMNTLNGSEVKEKYPNMRKTRMLRGSDGAYSMNLSIALSEKSLEEIQAEAAQNGGEVLAPSLEEVPIDEANAGATGI